MDTSQLRLQMEQQFEDLRTISENIADFLARELYKEYFGPEVDYTVNDILTECYNILIQELQDLGITITQDEDELLGDWYSAKRVYYIRYIADSSYLLDILIDPKLQNEVDMLTDTEVSNESLFTDIAYKLYAKYPERIELEHIQDILDLVTSNERYTAHVKSILKSLKEADFNVTIPDVAKAAEYISRIQKTRKLAAQAVETVIKELHLEGTIDRAKITKLLADYDLDKISPDNIKIYSLVDRDEVLPQLQNYKNKMMLQHHLRSPHHQEYWLSRKQRPPVENQILMVAHHWEPGILKPVYLKEVYAMLEACKELLDLQDVDNMVKMANAILTSVSLSAALSKEEE